ncbi:efflux transporter permease, aromatic acid exporter family protein [Hyphomicrobium denitrificans 1NES1]|uniref:Efflux transporter permease, aromatic acid exporter family protein n=1 Tax=Hyphomicrobium denitrificans 1NES1 TaxID=670307 RepID=N0B6C7_9HYPH|nr:FUSC family protein [Hyphomicrobium denitrificans]AGK59134.1 efflux transporter permease, aromatic acid exporter family protein [Hyphomicrobium denitrificans 1NES1]
MTVPGWRDWAFALKTFGAAVLALYLALWLDLPRPYWAVGTVYITSQVLAGDTRSKALYRALGTLVGAAISVALVPNLNNAPVVLSLAIAAWVSFCLYFSLLDRTPRSYVLMLAGYTAGIISFPAVDAPGTIFDTAVSRVEEITLGIFCASLVSIVVFPQSAEHVMSARLDAWIRSAREWVIQVVCRGHPGSDSQSQRLGLASDAIAFDALTTTLRYELSGFRRSAEALATLRQHMLMFLPLASAMADRVTVLERAGRLSPSLHALLADIASWLRSDRIDPDRAERLRRETERLEPPLDERTTWPDLIQASLLARLRDFIDLRQDVRLLQQHLRSGTRPPDFFAFSYTAKARTIRHRDHGMALLSAVGAFIAVVVNCAFWISTGWPDGASAPMMAAIACSFFAAFDDPAPYIVSFGYAAVLGAIGAAIYLFGVLPLATNFEMLMLALAPWLIVCGVFMTQPDTAPIARIAAVNAATMIAIQNGAVGEFALFANSTIAVLFGIWSSVVIVRLVRSVGAAWSAHRLERLNRESLVDAARHGGANHGLELAALMLDRVGLMAPRLKSLPPDDAEWIADFLSEVRVGIHVVEIRRVRRELPPRAARAIEHVLANTARYFREPPHSPRIGPLLLDNIDNALRCLLREPENAAQRTVILGLVGLRRAVFPKAQDFCPPSVSSPQTGILA